MADTLHVIPSDGGWAVVKEGDRPNGQRYERKRDAEAAARQALKDHGGGETVLHTPAGRITERIVVEASRHAA